MKGIIIIKVIWLKDLFVGTNYHMSIGIKYLRSELAFAARRMMEIKAYLHADDPPA